MKPLATFLAVALPCACTVLFALVHILQARTTMDQIDSDPMCLAYIYVSIIFYLLHSKLVTYLSNLISTTCEKLEPDKDQTYGYFSWIASTLCIILEMATLFPFSYRALALFVTAEPMVAETLSERFEVGAWILSVFLLVVFLIAPKYVPSRLLWLRFTIAYLVILAAPAYSVWSAHYIAATSQVVGRMLRQGRAAS